MKSRFLTPHLKPTLESSQSNHPIPPRVTSARISPALKRERKPMPYHTETVTERQRRIKATVTRGLTDERGYAGDHHVSPGMMEHAIAHG